jgi:pilus assembly protein CpaB
MIRIVLLLLCLGAAGAAAWLAHGLMRPPIPAAIEASAPEPEPVVGVLVALADIPRGARVEADALAWRDWPETRLADSYITRAAAPDAIETRAGAVARTGFVAGEPIVMGKLVMAPGGLLAIELAEGERAVAVSVSAESAAGGFVLPGDRVDVLATRNVEGAGPQVSAVLRNVEVLAIDQTPMTVGTDETEARVGKTATLRLSETQANVLLAAQISARLSLALRAVVDRDIEPEAADAAETTRIALPAPDGSGAPVQDAVSVLMRRAGSPTKVTLP